MSDSDTDLVILDLVILIIVLIVIVSPCFILSWCIWSLCQRAFKADKRGVERGRAPLNPRYYEYIDDLGLKQIEDKLDYADLDQIGPFNCLSASTHED